MTKSFTITTALLFVTAAVFAVERRIWLRREKWPIERLIRMCE